MTLTARFYRVRFVQRHWLLWVTWWYVGTFCPLRGWMRQIRQNEAGISWIGPVTAKNRHSGDYRLEADFASRWLIPLNLILVRLMAVRNIHSTSKHSGSLPSTCWNLPEGDRGQDRWHVSHETIVSLVYFIVRSVDKNIKTVTLGKSHVVGIQWNTFNRQFLEISAYERQKLLLKLWLFFQTRIIETDTGRNLGKVRSKTCRSLLILVNDFTLRGTTLIKTFEVLHEGLIPSNHKKKHFS